MTRITRVWAASFGVVAALGVAASAQQFRSGVDLVRLPVVVTGRDGLLVRGLPASAFEIREDGDPQTVAAFAEGAPGDAVPLYLGVLFDKSVSMEKDLREAASAAVQFVSALEEARDVTLVNFDGSLRISRFEPSSYPRLFERLREQKAEGMTALHDAIGNYLQSTATRPGQHVLLLYTDGHDSVSRLGYGQVLDLVRDSNAIIYAVGYIQGMPQAERLRAEMQLRAYAKESGGDVLFPATPKELHPFYARILDELSSRYTLGYVSTNSRADGKLRKVEVRLTDSAHRGAKIRTRAGYLAPRTAGR